jgi:hypothetical protein
MTAGSSCLLVWLAALDACRALSMDCLSYGRHYRCAQGVQQEWPASLCMPAPVCFPSPLVGLGVSTQQPI